MKRHDSTTTIGNAPLLACIVIAVLPLTAAGHDDDALLPDLVVRRSDLFDRRLDGLSVPGRMLLRFSTGAANIGRGVLSLRGRLPANGDGTQDVMQRVFHADGTFFERVAGSFIFHGEHDHTHFEGWNLYRLREVLPEDGVGDVIAESAKTGFCLVDLEPFDRFLPGFLPVAQFTSCTEVTQGLSVGWVDVYDKELPGQTIDITGLPDGDYWLEVTVNPDGNILESNDDNNVERIKITVGDPAHSPDAYEPNDSIEDLDGRPPGRRSSPNLGPCNPKRIVENLNLLFGSEDYFRFYANHVGGPGDFVRIDFNNSGGNLDMVLLDVDGKELEFAAGDADSEIIALDGRPEGWYHLRVFGRNGATNTNYRLVVNPPENERPAIQVIDPPVGGETRVHGADVYVVTWNVSDPEADLTWVTVYLNDAPILDSGLQLVTTGHLVDGEVGVAVINSAQYDPGTYWVYCMVTDGGKNSGNWATGTITFLDIEADCRTGSGGGDDCNGNKIIDGCEIARGISEDCNANGTPDACDAAEPNRDRNGNGVPDECELRFHRGDPNDDGRLDIVDVLHILGFLFIGTVGPTCAETADVDNDGKIDIVDAVFLLNFLFLGGPPPTAPGPPGLPCGPDLDSVDSPQFLGCASYGGCL